MGKVVKITLEQYNAYVNGYDVLNEDVFASGKKGKNKIQLSYNKRKSSNPTKNFGSINPAELLNTGKMDQDNADTFEVPLKGGIMSYNITSIRGTEIMHYFKNKHAKMDVDLNGDGQKESYDLWMDDPERHAFFNQFYAKINYVVKKAVDNFKRQDKTVEFNGVSIYPVPSSSHFNEIMAKKLAQYVKIDGMDVHDINQSLFRKDLTNLQKDNEFIKKNKDYYQSKMYKYGDDSTTHEQHVDKALNDYSNSEAIRNEIRRLVNEYNIIYNQMDKYYLTFYKNPTKTFQQTLAEHYKKLYDKFNEINQTLKQGRKRAIESDTMYKALQGTKSQVEARKTDNIWKLVKPYFRGTGVGKLTMHRLEPKDFQIKNLSNDTRMGMKNYFSSNADVVKQEMQKIKGTVFVIFDDNISGGATLSDICYQAKQLGIEYIVPITFGEMQMKYNHGIGKQITKPSKSGRFQNY